MSGWFRDALLAFAMAAAVGGCAGKHAGGVKACMGRSLAELFLPTQPKSVEFDDRNVGDLTEVERLLGLHRRPGYEYFELSAPECQCRAAAASTEGNSLAAERRSIESKEKKHHGLSESERLKIRILRASELEARNKSAGVALEVYYHLAEALANHDVVIAGIEETESALKKVAMMRGEGMAIPFDDSEITRQWLELTQKKVALELQTNQLNIQLVRLLGL